MASSVNKVILVGNLGRDPEVRSTQTGSKIANFTLATSETWNDKASGERKEQTEWHRIAVFNDRTVDFVEKYLKKGAKVYVEGQLKSRKWTDNGGVERVTTEIVVSQFRGEVVLLDGRGNGGERADAHPAGRSTGGGDQGRGGNQWEPSGDDDTEIPF